MANHTDDQNAGFLLSEQDEALTASKTPTQESVFFPSTNQDDRIKNLESQLKKAKLENLALQKMKDDMLLKEKSIEDDTEEQEEKQRMQAYKNTHRPQDTPSIEVSTDAVDDRNITILLEENAFLKERLRELESGKNSCEKDRLEVQRVRLVGMHPESCPSSVSTDSAGSRDSCDLSVGRDADEIHCLVLDPSNLATAMVTKQTIVAAAVASQRVALEKLQRELPNTTEVCNPGRMNERTFTKDMIGWLSENVGQSDWRPLMLKLGLTDHAVDIIMTRHPSLTKEQRYQGFLEWKRSQPSEATVQVLLQAMWALSLHQLAQDFCKQYPFDPTRRPVKKHVVRKMTRQQALEEDSPPKHRIVEMENIQQDLAAFAKSKDDTIKELKSQLAEANQVIQALQTKVDGLVPSNNNSPDASGNLNVALLLRENTGLQERFRRPESEMSSSGKDLLDVQDIKRRGIHPESCPSSMSVDSNSSTS